MSRIETLLVTTFERRMAGDQPSVLKDANRVDQDMNIENAPARRVRHAVEIAADADHALMRDPAFELEHRPIGSKRQVLQSGPFLGKGFIDDPMGGRMQARIGDRIQPGAEAGY